MADMSDRTPLLPGGPYISTPKGRSRILTSVLVPLLLIGAVIYVSIRGDGVPKDPLGRAKYWMNTYVPSPSLSTYLCLVVYKNELMSV